MERAFELGRRAPQEPVAVPFSGCHQHFERVPESADGEGRLLPVFV